MLKLEVERLHPAMHLNLSYIGITGFLLYRDIPRVPNFENVETAKLATAVQKLTPSSHRQRIYQEGNLDILSFR